MTRDEIKRGVAGLRRMRVRVAGGADVYTAWRMVTRCDIDGECRKLLLRHVRHGKWPFVAGDGVAIVDASGIPTAHALAWIDTAIAYAEEHGR